MDTFKGTSNFTGVALNKSATIKHAFPEVKLNLVHENNEIASMFDIMSDHLPGE